jgi:hypothetical protein
VASCWHDPAPAPDPRDGNLLIYLSSTNRITLEELDGAAGTQ